MSKKFAEKSQRDLADIDGEVLQGHTSEEFKIAIIGCGAAGVATLLAFLEYLPTKFNQKITITIFEKGPAFGPGFAYQCDNNELLMNMVSSTTSIFPNQKGDFWNWMLEKGCHIGGQQILSKSGVAPDRYISRQFFGAYLKSQFEHGISSLEKLGVEIELINLEVTNACVLGDNSFNVTFGKGFLRHFNCVILCVGNTAPKDIFNLGEKSQYINNPYPVNRYLQLIKSNDCVGIIGGQLTAADIAVVLANQGHKGPINFFTRDLYFPLTRCPIGKYDLQYLTHINLEILKSKNRNGISLRQIMRLARKEFLAAGITWNKFFKPSTKQYSSWVRSLLEDDEDFSCWQNLAIATDDVIGDYWNALSDIEKHLFMNKFHRLWSAKRVPLPVHTVFKLYSLFSLGILRHYPHLKGIDASVKNQFSVTLGNSKHPTLTNKVYCDWIINASGPSREISRVDSVLIKNLLESGLILRNPHGGIMLDYESSRIKNNINRELNNFYAIGHLTSGTYYFVSSLDMVSLRARGVVRHLTESLSYDSNPQRCISDFLYRGEYAS
ncbi:hypothetical protein A8O14_02780 [Polynucleobacter wuianus]|uniref:FAD-dependent urate hydroxylase HpyO/Asp monooxygenase CreE-like FAD/NAD(P)-binding domain-containing protein n=1 Tax=Polynucleobacter wuianus TaxID=1743168 RepID=A0A191UDZ2_9BURK|nr:MULTISPECIES: FAD/NAD(P)-binding protein [Polynucleobacter]ANI99110.1 hypothetical protein A8O14_02780 [Polynucleobacter wuianus]MBU3552315.1 FAD/NAD(P)-binding protein [Polynucleobacter sp. MWH-Post4-6-1]MBU3609078.1 FAD/NAD(P)-binding protein [Polynucleobacter wuianus]